MGSLRYQRSKQLGKNRVNLSKSGVSLSRQAGPLTLNSRGTGSFRIMPGWSYRFGKRNNGAAFVFVAVLACLWLLWVAVRLTAWLLWTPTAWVVRSVMQRRQQQPLA